MAVRVVPSFRSLILTLTNIYTRNRRCYSRKYSILALLQLFCTEYGNNALVGEPRAKSSEYFTLLLSTKKRVNSTVKCYKTQIMYQDCCGDVPDTKLYDSKTIITVSFKDRFSKDW